MDSKEILRKVFEEETRGCNICTIGHLGRMIEARSIYDKAAAMNLEERGDVLVLTIFGKPYDVFMEERRRALEVLAQNPGADGVFVVTEDAFRTLLVCDSVTLPEFKGYPENAGDMSETTLMYLVGLMDKIEERSKQ